MVVESVIIMMMSDMNFEPAEKQLSDELRTSMTA